MNFQSKTAKSDFNFPPDLDSQALLLQEFNEETESRHHDFYVFTMTLSLRITSNDFPFFHQWNLPKEEGLSFALTPIIKVEKYSRTRIVSLARKIQLGWLFEGGLR